MIVFLYGLIFGVTVFIVFHKLNNASKPLSVVAGLIAAAAVVYFVGGLRIGTPPVPAGDAEVQAAEAS